MEPVVQASYVSSLLLVCSLALFVVAVLTTTVTILLWRKNASLVELLHVESKRHTQELLNLNERFNSQLYNQQERASLQQSATVRQLLDSFSIAASGKPLS